MPRPNPIVTTATLVRRTGERTWDAVLPNGRDIIAHVPKWRIDSTGELREGQSVRMELTTYDLSMGRIAMDAG